MLYNRVKELRESENKKQFEIAQILNIYKGVYNQYENEYVIMPIKHLNTLVNYFQVSLDYVFKLSDKKNYQDNSGVIDKSLAGLRLKNWRKKEGLTQEKLASFLKVSRTTITEYERGKNIIATPFLYMICKKYQVSADYMLGKTKEDNLARKKEVIS